MSVVMLQGATLAQSTDLASTAGYEDVMACPWLPALRTEIRGRM